MATSDTNRSLLSELESMGFSEDRAIKALHSSGNSSLEAAVNWIIDHEDDADIDEMPMEPEPNEGGGNEPDNRKPVAKKKEKEKPNQLRKRAPRNEEAPDPSTLSEHHDSHVANGAERIIRKSKNDHRCKAKLKGMLYVQPCKQQ